MTPRYEILNGDALVALKTLKPASVQTCVTSPPYWGLRDYGVTPRAWGGEPNRSHAWGDEVIVNATNHRDKRRWNHAVNGRGEGQPDAKRPDWKRTKIGQGNYCACGAWRGVLGLEPTPEMYVAHVVELFREVRRVLKDDGTLWLNLGDSYYNGDKGGHPRSTTGKQTTNHGTVHGMTVNRLWQDGLKPKDLVGMPWRVAFALQVDGWWLRSDIIWHKTNPMPESVTDRPTKSHEYLFLLSKSAKYFYDADAIKEPASADTHARYARGRSDTHKYADGGPGNQTIAKSFEGMKRRSLGNVARKLGDGTDGRLNTHLGRSVPWVNNGQGVNRRTVWSIPGVNPKAALNAIGSKQNASFAAAVKDVVERRNKRTVWTISTKPFKGAHFATFPPKLIEPCILAGSRPGDLILYPFSGAGTSGLVALQHKRRYVGIELNPEYCEMSRQRIDAATGLRVKAA